MDSFFSHPLFGLLLSLACYRAGYWIASKVKISFVNPLILSTGFAVAFLLIFNIPLESYQAGGQMILVFLGPATVALALPLYRELALLKKHLFAVLMGVLSGSAAGVACIIFLSKALNLDLKLILSLVPKSITTPMGMELSKQIGGEVPITISAIVATGMIGALLASSLCRVFRIRHAVAKGIAIGTASHAMGTSRAVEIGQTEGAMSSLAMGIAGVMTVVMAPYLIQLFL